MSGQPEPTSAVQGLHPSAMRFAESALEGFLSEDYQLFLVHAATAAEQIGKARLAAIHPTLIVDPKNVDSLLHAAGALSNAPQQIRTISFRETVDRLIRIEPEMAEFRTRIGLLADIRNGVVHLGQLGEAVVARSVLVPFLRFTDACVVGIGSEPEQLWPADLLQQRNTSLTESDESDKHS